jgi:hypothetical protein
MSCWQTKDDIDLLADRFSEKEMTKDEVLNALVGVSQIHHMRSEKLFDIFERMLSNIYREEKSCESINLSEELYEDNPFHPYKKKKHSSD